MGGSYCCGPLNLGGNIDLGANTLTFSYQVNATGTIYGTGGLAIGDVITLSGPNTYTGPTTISQRGRDRRRAAGQRGEHRRVQQRHDQRHRQDRCMSRSTRSASIQPGQGFGGSIGKLSSGSVTFNASSYLYATLNGTVPGRQP